MGSVRTGDSFPDIVQRFFQALAFCLRTTGGIGEDFAAFSLFQGILLGTEGLVMG